MEEYSNVKISVVIPVHNGEKYIAEAIESVLAQTFKPYEIIVSDSSTDSTAAIVRSYPEVDYYYQPHIGISYALNAGLSHVRGNYIAFIDSDDLWVETKLEKQVQFLANNPDVEGVFAYHKRFYSKSRDHLTEAEREDMKRILPAYFKSTLLIRRDSFFKVGLFDTSINIGDFLDWYRRASDQGTKMDIIPGVLMFRRIHDSNSSTKSIGEIKDYVKIMKASLDRRRKSN